MEMVAQSALSAEVALALVAGLLWVDREIELHIAIPT
jgi:hypothetical protein